MKERTWLVGLLACLLLLAGCAPKTPQPDTPQTPGDATVSSTTATPEPLTYIIPGGDWGFPTPFAMYRRGPGYIQMSMVFDPLTWKDENGVIPWLAKSWELADDGVTWTFALNQDVRWHDGRPLTADDVAFTYDYYQQHQAVLMWTAPVDLVRQASAVDDHTVQLVLAEPYPDAMNDLFGCLPILPKHVWENVEDPATFVGQEATIGTGPFRLSDYSKEEGRTVYQANRDFFGGEILVDQLIYITVNDPAVALQTQAIDATTFWSKEISAVRTLEESGAYRITEGPSFWILNLVFNTVDGPFADVAARRAVATAVDRQRLVSQVTQDGALIASLGIVHPDTRWGHPALPSYTHDPASAKQAFQQLGLADTPITLITTSDYAREAEVIQADLEKAGLAITVQTGDTATVDTLMREGQFALAITGHGAIASPGTLQRPCWPAQTAANPAFDALVSTMMSTVDPDARLQQVHQLQEILADELPVLPLWHPRMWVVTRSDSPVSFFFTAEGIASGIPMVWNKLAFVAR